MTKNWFQENASRFSGELAFEEPLARHTYYRIGGPAAVLAVPKSKSDLAWIREGLTATGSPLFVMGAGSNLLVSDQGFPGVVVKTTKLNTELAALATEAGFSSNQRPMRIRTGGSVAVSTLLRRAMQDGWGGMEFLCGIPGSIGGAVMMNAGTHVGETKDRLLWVEAFPLLGDGCKGTSDGMLVFEGDMLKFEYRRNLFLPQGSVVWAAEWRVHEESPQTIRKTLEEMLNRRKDTQPVNFPSCGSVFKNPKGKSAWQVVNEVGLRGHRVGNAQFSVKHSNFIVNLGGAAASDVMALIRLAQERARERLGIELEPEVRLLGTFAE